MAKSSNKIRWQELHNTSVISSPMVVFQDGLTNSYHIFFIQLVKAYPEPGWSSINISPHLKWDNSS